MFAGPLIILSLASGAFPNQLHFQALRIGHNISADSDFTRSEWTRKIASHVVLTGIPLNVVSPFFFFNAQSVRWMHFV